MHKFNSVFFFFYIKNWKYYEIRNGITKILGNNRVGEAKSLKKKKKKRFKKEKKKKKKRLQSGLNYQN